MVARIRKHVHASTSARPSPSPAASAAPATPSARISPVSSVSGRSRWPTTSATVTPRARIESGPASIWRYRPAAAGARRRRGQAQHRARLDEAGQGRQPRQGTRAASPAREGRLAATPPTPSRTGSWRSRVEAARNLRLPHAVVLLHRQPRRRGHRGRRPRRARRLRVHPGGPGGRPRSSWPRCTAAGSSAIEGTYDDVNRFCSELIGDPMGEKWGFVNVNLRPYYAEGSKTLAYEIAEQLGWRLPDQIVIPVASGSQLTKIDKGFQELIKLGLVEDRPYKIFGAQADGLLAGVRRVQGRPRRGAAGQAGHHRQVAGDRQPRRRPVRARHRPAHRRRGGGRHGRTRSSTAIQPARPHRGHLRRDGGRRHRRRAAQARRGPASSTRTPRPWCSTPATGSRRSTRSPPGPPTAMIRRRSTRSAPPVRTTMKAS